MAAGEIADVRYNFDRTGFTIVDHRDIPGRNIVALIDEDQPSLAATRVRHVAEPIVLLAHSDRTRLAAAEVAVTYRETTPNFDPERSDVSFKLIAINRSSVTVDTCENQVARKGYRAQVLLMRIGWAPCQSASRPSSGRCSAPETMVRK